MKPIIVPDVVEGPNLLDSALADMAKLSSSSSSSRLPKNQLKVCKEKGVAAINRSIQQLPESVISDPAQVVVPANVCREKSVAVINSSIQRLSESVISDPAEHLKSFEVEDTGEEFYVSPGYLRKVTCNNEFEVEDTVEEFNYRRVIPDGDVISRLPTDLLISILSRLTLKEAMLTSVLSRRWEKLWTFYHGNLDFDVPNEIGQNRCSNYVRLVNKVLDTLELVEGGGVFESFTVQFNLCPNNLSSIHRWVQFALEKRRFKRLEFDNIYFKSQGDCSHYNRTYDFPLLQCFNSQQRNIQALTSIRFWRVNVSGETIEHFLSNCPLLQSLELIDSRKPLIHLRVLGETLALKHLVIRTCPNLTTIEISAPNLVSLNYQSDEKTNVKFDVCNVPMLVYFSIGGLRTPLTALTLRLFACFPYIQKLKLYICSEEPEDYIKIIKMNSVKHLTMKFVGHNCGSILAWTPLLKAFPALEKFTVDMRLRWEKGFDGMTKDHDKFPNKCLKVFEFLGFGKSDSDIELVMHFLKKSATLEKILLHCDGRALLKYLYASFEETPLRIAEKLKEMIPKEVNLVIS